MKQPVERRLAAILAADVAGYSRLMGADEEGTHERLRGHLRELVDPTIKGHHGRVVKNTGDGMLVSSQAWSMRFAARSRSSAIWQDAMPMSQQTGGSSFASGSISAM